MEYRKILNEIKPDSKEKAKLKELSSKLINSINKISIEEELNARAEAVGSVAKETYLKGKSDIDIFIVFPLNTPLEVLKEKGLEIGYKISEEYDGQADEHYASHPYLTSIIEGFEVDFVPCYNIKDASEMESAVDRTILHTKYIKSHLKYEQVDEVLLLKRFMDCIGVYGSEFKVGGFAGYLCEILILKYGSFENVTCEVSNWRYKTIIDLEDYGTSEIFEDPLIAIDPTDKNRNVAAALRKDKKEEFIYGCRNFIESDNKLEYFYPIKKDNLSKNNIIEKFHTRGSKTYIIEFHIPSVPVDTLHPQLKKTEESLREKIEEEGFEVFESGYWTNEKDKGILIYDMNVSKLNNIKVHYGPKIWAKQACINFKKANGNKCYVLDEFLVVDKEREFKTVAELIENIFTKENIFKIKIGKNLKNIALNTFKLYLIENYLKTLKNEDLDDFLNFLDDFINPGQHTRR